LDPVLIEEARKTTGNEVCLLLKGHAEHKKRTLSICASEWQRQCCEHDIRNQLIAKYIEQ